MARSDIEAELVMMIDEGEGLKGNAFGDGEATSDEFFAWRDSVITFVGEALGATERQRLREIEPTGPDLPGQVAGIVSWLRQRRDQPESWTPHLTGEDLEAAIKRRRHEDSSEEESLADRLDSMMQEGMSLLGELSVPVQPQKKNGVWKLSGGDAPKEWWDQAAAFQQRIRDLLQAEHPALLTDFRDGCNAHLHKEREARDKHDPAADKRSTSEKMLDLANFERSGPAREVEAFLEGLAAARHRLAAPQA